MYQPLPVPKKPWEDVSIDFFLVLSRTQHGHDSIFVVIERFSTMVHFTPFKNTSDDAYVVELVLREVVRLHDLPKSIVLDQDTKFVGYF